jgi:isoleucyl-tRNA synthetase
MLQRPFITEEIYQNLVRSGDKKAPISIHLCKYPEYDADLIDQRLENDMDVAYKIVQLGRAARNDANIKNRQPLSKMEVNFREERLPDYYIGIIKEELNIKNVEFRDDLKEYVDYGFKINYPVLGPKYGKLVPRIGEALKSTSPKEAFGLLKSEGAFKVDVAGEEVALTADDVEVTMKGREGFTFQTNGFISVVLDKELTEELINEGYTREIISKIQTMRKDSGFEVADRISFYYFGNSKLDVIIKQNLDFIKSETLSDTVSQENIEGLAYTEWNINGEKLQMGVKRI